jgi:hypothetical protein
MRTAVVAVGLALIAAPALAEATVDDLLAEAKADCASFENGVLTVPPETVTQIELTGDATPETLFDWGKLQCSTMASAWGGSGGSMLSVLAGGLRWDFLAHGWTVADLGGPVLLLAVHGGECGGSGAQRCVEAQVWGGESFLSVRPPGGDEDAQPVEEDEGAAP